MKNSPEKFLTEARNVAIVEEQRIKQCRTQIKAGVELIQNASKMTTSKIYRKLLGEFLLAFPSSKPMNRSKVVALFDDANKHLRKYMMRDYPLGDVGEMEVKSTAKGFCLYANFLEEVLTEFDSE